MSLRRVAACLFLVSALVHCAAQTAPESLVPSPSGNDIVFKKTKLAGANGKHRDVLLIFRPDAKVMLVQAKGEPLVRVPYSNIDKLSYDYSKHHRIKQGAVIMAASLGAGAVVMATKSKDHWFTVDYHEADAPKSLVLKLDKKEYKDVLRSATAQTGKQIDFEKDAKL